MAEGFIYWDELRGLPVNVVHEGRTLGLVEGFYYQTETHSINALRVNAGLRGHCILLASAIASLDRNRVALANEQMLIAETNAGSLQQLPLGDQLTGYKVTTESGRQLGTISRLLVGIYPPIALRISALEVNGNRSTPISAGEITRFNDNEVVITDQAGRNIS